MKKLILLIFILAGWQFSKAQTVEETVEYINIKLSQEDGEVKSVTTENDFIYPYKWNTESRKLTEIRVANWISIKSINYLKMADGNWKINVRGNFTVYQNSYSILDYLYQDIKFKKISSVSFVDLPFPNGFSETDVQKLVAALKHLATLNGAKLLKDDLF